MMTTAKKPQKTTIVVDGEETVVLTEHLTLAQHLMTECRDLEDSTIFFSIVRKVVEYGATRKTAIQICKNIRAQLLNQKKSQ